MRDWRPLSEGRGTFPCEHCHRPHPYGRLRKVAVQDARGWTRLVFVCRTGDCHLHAQAVAKRDRVS